MRESWKHFTAEEVASWPVEHKMCRACHEVLSFSAFGKNKATLYGLDTKCKECRKPKARLDAAARTHEQNMLAASKHRAKQRGIPHTITLEDIVIPDVCPILGVKIDLTKGSEYAPSLDQIQPRKGYTPDNIVVMSRRANTLKNNMSKEEAAMVAAWMADNCNWTIVRL